MASRDSVLSEAMQLPPGDRAELARELLASLEALPEEDVDAAWLAEAERRLHDIEQGLSEPAPWDAVRARIAARLQNIRG